MKQRFKNKYLKYYTGCAHEESCQGFHVLLNCKIKGKCNVLDCKTYKPKYPISVAKKDWKMFVNEFKQ